MLCHWHPRGETAESTLFLWLGGAHPDPFWRPRLAWAGSALGMRPCSFSSNLHSSVSLIRPWRNSHVGRHG